MVTPGRLRDTLVSRVVEPALAALPYVSEATGRFYFGKAREYRTAGILATSKPEVTASQRLDVIDLPSLSDRDIRSLIVNALLAEEWSRARAAWMQALEAPTGDREADVRRVTTRLLGHLEQFIREHPDQWHLPHRIWDDGP